MHRTLTACRTGLAVTAAIVLLSACGGSDDPESSGASQTSSSASESSADAAGSEFCQRAGSIEERVGSTLEDQSDLANLPQALEEAATEIRAIDPPPEIASDWDALAAGVEEIAAAFGEFDLGDPEALATFEERVTELEGRLDSASTNVENYLRDECGIEPSSPTS